MSLGKRIRQLRVERGWTQAELADKVGVYQGQISAYEKGKNEPSSGILRSMAEVFEVSADYLLFDDASGRVGARIRDADLLSSLERLDRLPEDDKSAIKTVIGIALAKDRMQRAALGVEG